MTDTYTTKLDMQTGTISVHCGDARVSAFSVLIDEWPEIQEKAQAEYERAKAIMGNPLLDTRLLDEAMAHYTNILNSGGNAISLKPLVEFYQNTLVMLGELKTLLDRFEPHERFLMQHIPAAMLDISEWHDKIAAILEAHKHNMPAIVEGE